MAMQIRHVVPGQSMIPPTNLTLHFSTGFSRHAFFDPLGHHGKLEYPDTSGIEDGPANLSTPRAPGFEI
jgi:hypothetical protein